MINAIISAFAIGQCLLTSNLLASRIRHSNVYTPLALLFLANAIVQLCFVLREPIFNGQHLSFLPKIQLFKLLVEFSLPPLLWIYVRELTSKFTRGWRRTDIWHFVFPIMPCLLVAVLFFLFQNQVGGSSQNNFVDILNSILNLTALGQYSVYTTFVILRLRSYRRKLMDMFASTTDMELKWFRWFMLLVITTIVLEVSAEVLSEFRGIENPHRTLNGTIRAIIVWFFAMWGLRQRPDLKIEVNKTYADDETTRKYEKSSLPADMVANVSKSIVAAVENEKLFRDPDLSLRILSEKINILPNYVSQVLNMEMKETFFDYVNRLRVNDAMERLRNSDATVLAISTEVGFNSRSSFYTAFKKVTGKTPTAYRNSHLSSHRTVES